MLKKRKRLTGIVVSNSMDKTVVVKHVRCCRHLLYRKVVRRVFKTYAHYEGSRLAIGTEVTVEATRPLSRLKRWKVVSVALSSVASN